MCVVSLWPFHQTTVVVSKSTCYSVVIPDPPEDSPSPEATEGGQSQCPTDQPTDDEVCAGCHCLHCCCVPSTA